MNKKMYESEHKKLCDEMTKRYGAEWVKDKRVKDKIRDAAKQSARNMENAVRTGVKPTVQQKHEPEDKVKEDKKPAEVFVN